MHAQIILAYAKLIISSRAYFWCFFQNYFIEIISIKIYHVSNTIQILPGGEAFKMHCVGVNNTKGKGVDDDRQICVFWKEMAINWEKKTKHIMLICVPNSKKSQKVLCQPPKWKSFTFCLAWPKCFENKSEISATSLSFLSFASTRL